MFDGNQILRNFVANLTKKPNFYALLSRILETLCVNINIIHVFQYPSRTQCLPNMCVTTMILLPTGSSDPEWGIFKLRMSVHACVRACVHLVLYLRDALMALFDILQDHVPCPWGYACFFRFRKKIKIGNFTAIFQKKINLPDFKMLQVCSESVLRNGLMDSFEILQQYDQHSTNEFCFFRI